jgi:hypothetical protein
VKGGVTPAYAGGTGGLIFAKPNPPLIPFATPFTGGQT